MSGQTIVFITGSGHSGSTLLDMCLGGHSKISALGETGFLYFYANKTTDRDTCTCGKPVEFCPFWQPVADELARMLGAPAGGVFKNFHLSDPDMMRFDAQGRYRNRRPGEKVINASFWRNLSIVLGNKTVFHFLAGRSKSIRTFLTAAENRRKLYQAVSRAHHKPIIIDSTKTAGAVKEAYMERRGADVKFITIYRDGRAVAASHKRRLNIPMAQAARMWRNDILKWRLARLTLPKEDELVIHYEEFCSDPRKVLGQVCTFLGIQFEESMLDFRANRHNLGGNPMRHRTEETVITFDERWRRELTPDDLSAFNRAAGWLNRFLGYRG